MHNENNTSKEAPSNLVSFVCDPTSKEVVDATIKEMGLGYTESFIGEIDDMFNYLKEKKTPKIILIDISNSELPMSDLTKISEICSPEVHIIVAGSKNDVGLFRELLRFGVDDYLSKPLTTEILKKAINNITVGVDAYDNTESRNGKIITFIGSNGGIGTTTLAANSSWMLANKFFKRTLIVDCDFQFGDLNLFLDLKTENSYLDILESPDKIDDYFVETILQKHGPKLYYLGGLTDITRNIEHDPESFSIIIDSVRKQFNYIICDTPCHFDAISKNVISKTKFFVLVAELSMASAQNTMRILELLKQEARGKKIIVVINNVGKYVRGAVGKDEFEKVINLPISHMIPFDEYTPLGAANVGQPVASLSSSMNPSLEEILQDMLGNTIITNKLTEVYNDSFFSAINLKRLARKFGINDI